MNAINTIERIIQTNLIKEDLKYCLVNSKKVPFTVKNTFARTNVLKDFVNLDELLYNDRLSHYSGVGISVQASKVIAIDIDNCVVEPFNIKTINTFALEVIEIFKDISYIEFSFSGTGIRILLKSKAIENYSENYRINNSTNGLEFYQYTMNGRYVTITGRYIYNNTIKDFVDNKIIIKFLDKYMKRIVNNSEYIGEETDDRSIKDLLKIVRRHYIKDYNFQDLWFSKAPGSGKDESERDFFLTRYIFYNITKDRNKVKELFEQSDFFKSKDERHLYKWNRNNGWYFNYMFDNILGGV